MIVEHLIVEHLIVEHLFVELLKVELLACRTFKKLSDRFMIYGREIGKKEKRYTSIYNNENLQKIYENG